MPPWLVAAVADRCVANVARPDFRGANWKGCMSHVTLRWLSKKKYNVAVERPPPMIMRPGQAAPRRPDWPGPSVVPSDGRGWAQAYREALLVGGNEPLAIAYACGWRMSSKARSHSRLGLRSPVFASSMIYRLLDVVYRSAGRRRPFRMRHPAVHSHRHASACLAATSRLSGCHGLDIKSTRAAAGPRADIRT